MQKMDTADGEQKQQQKGEKRKALAERGLSGTKGNSKVEKKKIPSVHHIISYHYILSHHQFKVFSRRMGADIGVPGKILL